MGRYRKGTEERERERERERENVSARKRGTTDGKTTKGGRDAE